MSIVKLKDIHYKYGETEVLKGISFSIEKSRFIGVIGANGCGKTTLLRNISGYFKPCKGSIYIYGKDINELSTREKARLIGYVPQEPSHDFEFSCFDVVMMGRLPHLGRFQRERALDADIVKKCMELTGTWEYRGASLAELSGGQRQRVYIARALAQKPGILLLDEPVSYLDIKYQIEILSLLKELTRGGILVITVLHDVNLASQFCNEILLMKDGLIVSSGTPEQVLTNDNIEDAFSISVKIMDNPVSNTPYIIPTLKVEQRLKVV